MLIGKPTEKDLQKCWESNKDYFLKALAKDQHKPFDRGEMEYRFLDMNGRKYYAFPKNLPAPIERTGKEMEFMMWMSAGLTSHELDRLLDAQDKALMGGLKTGKNAAKIGAIITEIRERKNMVLHTELLYNWLAAIWIREDENPLVYNNEIQLEKVAQFKKEVAESNSYFFFHQPELERLNYLWKLSESEWNQYWQESLLQQEVLKEKMKIYEKTYTSENGSEDTLKTEKKA